MPRIDNPNMGIEVVQDDNPESLHQMLDEAGIPRIVALGEGSGQLTVAGRLQLLGEKTKHAEDAAATSTAALETIRVDPGERMLKARQLLAQSFKYLQGFEGTADLRQQIKLFLEKP